MDFLVVVGFTLCMLYLFYEREGRKKPRTQAARTSRAGASKGKRSTRKKSR